MQKWSSARSLLDTALAYAFINELADRKESMVIKFSDGITLSDIKSTADRVWIQNDLDELYNTGGG